MPREYRLLPAIVTMCLLAVIGLAQGQSDPNQSNCQTTNLSLEKACLLRYEESGGYDHDIKAAIDKAKTYLTEHSTEKGKLAVVLDIDETALSNWPELKADDFAFFLSGPCDLSVNGVVQAPCGWNKWVELEKAPPIVPTLELYRQARSQGVKVFFITGRTEAQRAATAANLRTAGYEGFTDSDLIMKPTDSHLKSLATFKTAARKVIAAAGYVIVLNVGDQYSDLSGDYAQEPIKLPNPFYYVP
jgi:predicted secreted acid phosphatase